MTLAVFRPTPGRFTSSSKFSGIFELYLSTKILESAIIFFAFVLYSPIVFMYFFKLFSPSSKKSSGFLWFLNNSKVALFTEISVAWADKITATVRVKLLTY